MSNEVPFFQRMSNAFVAGVVAGVAGVTFLTAIGHGAPDPEPPAALPSQEDAAAFVRAWDNMRNSTWVADQSFVRRTDAGGSFTGSIHEAQRKPDYVRLASGSVTYDVGGRKWICATPSGQTQTACREAPNLNPWDRRVADEVANVQAQVQGDQRSYDVDESTPGCFELFARPTPMRSTWGTRATFCFDAATGAPLRSTLRREGGTDTTTTIGIKAAPTAADFQVTGIPTA